VGAGKLPAGLRPYLNLEYEEWLDLSLSRNDDRKRLDEDRKDAEFIVE
jgi:hypothetical protein